MSNRRNSNYTTSSSSSPSSDFSKKNNINEEINEESETSNRPLSLYDNLNALVASLKPPGINENSFIENFNKNLNNNNNNNNHYNNNYNNGNNNYNRNSGVHNNIHNNNNKCSDLLFKVKQEDFLFSDIKFDFPKIPQNIKSNSGFSDNDRNDEIKLNGNKNMSSNNSNNRHLNSNNNNFQYVNLDADTNAVANKPVHSDAKSSFFGLNSINNSNHNKNISNYNGDTPPPRPPPSRQLLQSMPNSDNGAVDHNNTLIAFTPVKSTPVNVQSHSKSMSDEDGDVSEASRSSNTSTSSSRGGDPCDKNDNNNNNNSNGGDSNEYDENKRFLNSSESREQRQVTYITPEKYGYDNKPSQAVYMTTTVPQNIKGNNIMGRHTPTRNSLRHSRMLVVNKHFQGGFEKSNPMNLQCPGLLRLLLILALISGLLLTSLALWIQVWAPNTRIQDNPYWSGTVLILCSLISLKLLNFKRATRSKFRKICFKVLKINSIIFSVAAIILSFLAFVFAFIHFKNLWYVDDHCIPSKLFTETSECMCIFGVHADYSDHMKIKNPDNLELPIGGYTFHYKDLNCNEVKDAWRYIVLASAIINFVGFLAIVFYLFVFFFKAKKRKQPNITVNRMSNINIT